MSFKSMLIRYYKYSLKSLKPALALSKHASVYISVSPLVKMSGECMSNYSFIQQLDNASGHYRNIHTQNEAKVSTATSRDIPVGRRKIESYHPLQGTFKMAAVCECNGRGRSHQVLS
jgi:hypothetical protein